MQVTIQNIDFGRRPKRNAMRTMRIDIQVDDGKRPKLDGTAERSREYEAWWFRNFESIDAHFLRDEAGNPVAIDEQAWDDLMEVDEDFNRPFFAQLGYHGISFGDIRTDFFSLVNKAMTAPIFDEIDWVLDLSRPAAKAPSTTTTTPAMAADLVDHSQPQRLLRDAEVAIEVVDAESEIATTVSSRPIARGTWITGSLLDTIMVRWGQVCHETRTSQERDRIVHITLRAAPHTYRDITFATILAVAQHHVGQDIKIAMLHVICSHPSDYHILDDHTLIAQLAAAARLQPMKVRP